MRSDREHLRDDVFERSDEALGGGQQRARVLFDAADGYVDTPVYDRGQLKAGAFIAGPAIVEQLDSTTVILPRMSATIERFGNIFIETGAAATPAAAE